MRSLVFIFFCSLYAKVVVAQDPVSRSITNQNGLPSNTVYNLLQDKKGFIWLGHDKGLSRFDGSSFTHFIAPAQQGKSVSNLLEINNSIWCQDFSGNFYHTQNDTLIKETNFKTSGIYSAAGILNNEFLSIVNYDTIRSFNINKNKNIELASDNVTIQAVFHSNEYSYFFTPKKLKRFNGKIVEVLQNFETPIPNFSFLIKIKENFIAFNKKGYPLIYKINSQQVAPLPLLKNGLFVQDVSIIQNEIWVSTTSGAYCFNQNMQPLYNGQCFFEETSITKIIKDRENNYWFGTLNKGVIMVPDIDVKLYKYNNESITALSIYNNGNEVLAGTSSNLIFTFNSFTNTYKTIIKNQTKGEIFSLYYDKPLKKIIACGNGIVYYQNEKKIKEDAIGGKWITPLNESTYAVAYSGGIALTPRKNNIIQLPVWLNKYSIKLENNQFLTQGFRGRTVLFDEATQTLYTATSQGLKFYNASGSNFILHNHKSIYASSLCLINGGLYAGTYSDGLYKIKNNTVELVNDKVAILAKTIYKLYSDSNNIWIASDELIQRYNTLTNVLLNFTSADGLPKAEVKDILVQNGKTYVATTEGLVILNSNKSSINIIAPLLQLNKLLVNNNEISIENRITLKPNENNIELLFSVLAFKENTAVNVSYKLNNDDWKILPKGLRNLQLALLAPGNYIIEIKAENEDGIKAEKNIIINFTIATPFYKKGWFYALIVGLTIATIYFYFKQQLKTEKHNSELLEQKISLEQELHQSILSSIKSQMNPHFLFNALNTIQSYIYTNDKENASLYLGKFSELTRTILEMSNKEKVSVADEIKALKLYIELEQLRFEEKLTYTFVIDDAISTETTFIPSMLIQPYIENAIKHGLMHQKKTGVLSVSLTQKANAIVVTIDDNGVGRRASEAINKQRSKTHQSFATNANQKRLHILNKGLAETTFLNIIDKIDVHGYATGTTIILHIPVIGIS